MTQKPLRTPLIAVLTSRYHISDIKAIQMLMWFDGKGEKFETEEAFIKRLNQLDGI